MRRLWVQGLDLALLAVAAVCALWLRENLSLDPAKVADLFPYLTVSLAIAAPINIFLGIDHSLWRYSSMADYLRILVAVTMSVGGATLVMFLINRLDGVSRSVPLLQMLIAVALIVGGRVLYRLISSRLSAPTAGATVVAPMQGTEPQGILIVGLTDLAVLYLKCIEAHAPERYRVGGILAHDGHHVGRQLRQYQVFDRSEELGAVLRAVEVHGVRISRIVVALSPTHLPARLAAELRDVPARLGVHVEYLTSSLGLDCAKPSGDAASQPVPSTPAAVTRSFRLDAVQLLAQRPYWRLKRGMDAVLAGLLLIVLSPVIVVVSSIVALAFGRPSVFWQDRPGAGGRPFRLLKFCTMTPAHDSTGRRLSDPERVGRIGHFLRSTRLDELPQLWNILAGEMSFVGPRPLLPVDQPEACPARLLIRPGLTGWAQVMGGREIGAEEKALLDVWYIAHASLRLDVEIMLRTLPMLLLGERIKTNAVEVAHRDLVRLGILFAEPDLLEEAAHERRSAVAMVALGDRAA